jgi:tetratricopeptide (TPR) repeat protein
MSFALVNLGVAYNASRDFTNALAAFQRALQLEPGNAAALKNQGIALRHLGRHDDAMASFRRSAQREPNDPELHREVGDLMVRHGAAGRGRWLAYDRALIADHATRPRTTIGRSRALARGRYGARGARLSRGHAISARIRAAHHTLGAF